jgi:HlyD family secretion protein
VAGLAVVALLGLGLGGWATKTELAGAVIATGTIVVDSNVKKVQHPIGGIVKELLVRNGDSVKAGQVLVRLDDTQARANFAIHSKRLDELMARQARQEAERDGTDQIGFPTDLLQRIGEPNVARLIEAQERLFDVRRKAREGQKAQLRERIDQLRQEVVGLQAQEAAKDNEVEWIGKELDGVTSLWEKNLVQLTRVVALHRDLASAEGDRGRFTASMAECKKKIAEIELQIIQIDQDLRAEVGKELATIRAEMAETAEQKIAAEDVFLRTQIQAPQDGIVHELTLFTIGGVVAAGEAMMLIVPANDTLDVEARIPPEAIDQLHVGQTAVVRFSAFNQRTTPETDGTVTFVSADLVQDPITNERYYSARITINQKLNDSKLGLMPGMPVEVFIRTHNRTVISYLMKPLTEQIMRSSR